jgi:hypothetical protein
MGYSRLPAFALPVLALVAFALVALDATLMLVLMDCFVYVERKEERQRELVRYPDRENER